MVKLDLLEGLREALSRGQSLRNAMMSFYNAGYSKEEIEQAAKALQMQGPVGVFNQQAAFSKDTSGFAPTSAQQDESTERIKQGINSAKGELQKISVPPKTLPTQTISGYVPKPETKSKIGIALLIIFMILLLGVIISLFLFKDQIIDLIKSSGFLGGFFS